jgi:hypothetical protein
MRLAELPNFPKFREIMPSYQISWDSERIKNDNNKNYNHALSEVGELECPKVPSVSEIQDFLTECVHLGTCIYDKNCHENKDMAEAVHNLIIGVK